MRNCKTSARSRPWWNATAASCRCTATGCSGSYEEAEDLTQETFLRAWRKRETYAQRASLRAWLYRIATNACLDALEKRPKTPAPNGEITWLQPFPDAVAAPLDEDVFARETIELAFMVAIQHLAPRPRAVLILRDVLGWRARDCAELLETTEAGVNSALQRARAVLKEHLPKERGEWTAEGSAEERELLDRYMALCEAGDARGIKVLMHEDARFSMPPDAGGVLRERDDRRRLGRGRVRHPRVRRGPQRRRRARTASRRSRTTCASPARTSTCWRRSTCSGSRMD